MPHAHHPSSSVAAMTTKGVPKAPVWLYRVQEDEMSALLRASSEYARTGYGASLHLSKTTGTEAAARTKHRASRKFENSVLAGGSVPTMYMSGTTGRSLTTQHPEERPGGGVRVGPPATQSKEVEEAIAQRAAREARKAAKAGSSPGGTVRPVDEIEAAITAALGPKEAPPDPSRIPLSKLKGLVHHPVENQLVVLPPEIAHQHHGGNHNSYHGGRPDSSMSGTRAGSAGGSAFSDSAPPDVQKMTLPKASDVLKRYKMFTVRTDAPTNRNLDAMLHPDALDLEKAARPVAAAAIVAQGRANMARSGTINTIAAPPEARPAGTLPRGGLSHAILQNKLGSTRMGAGDFIPRGGSGLVVGDLLVSHDSLTPATLVAAKWGRIARTEYAKVASEPCRMRCEFQPIYYESFLADMEQVLGGKFEFAPDVQPAVFLVDLGSVNAAVHGHRASNQRPPRIGSEKEYGTGHGQAGGPGWEGGGGDMNGTGAAGGGGGRQGDDADEEEEDEEEDEDADDGSGSPSSKPNHARFDLSDLIKSKKSGDALAVDDDRARRDRIRKIKKKRNKAREPPTQEEVRRAELRQAMELGKEKANELLLKLCTDGNDFAVDQLLKKGYKIDYTPNPWYMQLAENTKQKRVEARQRTFTEEGAGGNNAPTPRNNAGYALPKNLTKEGAVQEAEEEGDQGDAASGGGSGFAGPKGAITRKSKHKKDPEVFVLPDVNTVDDRGNTPLMRASMNGWIDVAIVLLAQGADHTRKNEVGQTAFDLARAESNMASLALGVHIPGAPERKRRAAKLAQMLDTRSVLVCAQKGDMRRLQYLLEEAGHPINAINAYGMTPLHFAVIRRDMKMIAYLSAQGADINARNNLGQSPLSLILDAGGDILQGKMLEALSAGDKSRAAEAAAHHASAAEAAEAAAREQSLVKALKTVTRGTTAAKAVHMSLAHVRDPSFGPLAGTPQDAYGADTMGYRSAPNTSLAAMVNMPGFQMPPIAGGRGGGGGGHSSSSSSSSHFIPGGTNSASGSALPSLQHNRPSTTLGGSLPPGLAVVPGIGAAPTTFRPISRALKKEAMKDAGALAETWNRHMLNYLANTAKAAELNDAKKAIAAREMEAEVNAARRRQNMTRRSPSPPPSSASASGGAGSLHQSTRNFQDPASARPSTAASRMAEPPGTSHGDRLGQTTGGGRSGRGGGGGGAVTINDAVRHAMSHPGEFTEAAVRGENMPAVNSTRFESWARLRFGVV